MEKYAGRWKMSSVENAEALFNVYEVAQGIRDHMMNSDIHYVIRFDGEILCVTMEIGGKGRELRIKLGEEFDDVAPSGDPYKGVVNFDGEKFIGKTYFTNRDTEGEIIRRLEGSSMIVTVSAKGQTMTQVYERVGDV